MALAILAVAVATPVARSLQLLYNEDAVKPDPGSDMNRSGAAPFAAATDGSILRRWQSARPI